MSLVIAATEVIPPRSVSGVEPESPRRRLARLAATYARTLREGGPPTRDRPAFARQVAVVRWQLGPLCDRALLAASFARESGLGAGIDPWRLLRTSPAATAYAIRWLELGSRHAPHAHPRVAEPRRGGTLT